MVLLQLFLDVHLLDEFEAYLQANHLSQICLVIVGVVLLIVVTMLSLLEELFEVDLILLLYLFLDIATEDARDLVLLGIVLGRILGEEVARGEHFAFSNAVPKLADNIVGRYSWAACTFDPSGVVVSRFLFLLPAK